MINQSRRFVVIVLKSVFPHVNLRIEHGGLGMKRDAINTFLQIRLLCIKRQLKPHLLIYRFLKSYEMDT